MCCNVASLKILKVKNNSELRKFSVVILLNWYYLLGCSRCLSDSTDF